MIYQPGGASGIGLATAKLLSSRGATICIADIDPAALTAAESHFIGLDASFMVTKLDVSKRPEVDTWIDSIIQEFGKLDGAVNSAGVIGKHHGITEITELEDEEWHRIISVNLTGLMYCLRAELRKISEGGSIVNLSSIQGVMGTQSLSERGYSY
jgi:NAD(P)-dependent dehydrogenase (short-subunit alcohol dehydrogenase family)